MGGRQRPGRRTSHWWGGGGVGGGQDTHFDHVAAIWVSGGRRLGENAMVGPHYGGQEGVRMGQAGCLYLILPVVLTNGSRVGEGGRMGACPVLSCSRQQTVWGDARDEDGRIFTYRP